MARYIDADKLCENLKTMAKYQEHYKQSTILGVVSTIENTPTADVVEVVRCKDCKHSCMIGVCPFTYQDVYECLKGAKEAKGETDFCSCGERKEQG